MSADWRSIGRLIGLSHARRLQFSAAACRTYDISWHDRGHTFSPCLHGRPFNRPNTTPKTTAAGFCLTRHECASALCHVKRVPSSQTADPEQNYIYVDIDIAYSRPTNRASQNGIHRHRRLLVRPCCVAKCQNLQLSIEPRVLFLVIGRPRKGLKVSFKVCRPIIIHSFYYDSNRLTNNVNKWHLSAPRAPWTRQRKQKFPVEDRQRRLHCSRPDGSAPGSSRTHNNCLTSETLWSELYAERQSTERCRKCQLRRTRATRSVRLTMPRNCLTAKIQCQILQADRRCWIHTGLTMNWSRLTLSAQFNGVKKNCFVYRKHCTHKRLRLNNSIEKI